MDYFHVTLAVKEFLNLLLAVFCLKYIYATWHTRGCWWTNGLRCTFMLHLQLRNS